MRRLARFFGYLVYTLFIGLVLYYGTRYGMDLYKEASATFESFPGVFIYRAAFPILVGVLLSIPQFVNGLGVPGVWTFNWARFLGVGIPCLLILAAPFIHYSQIGQGLPVWISPLLETVPYSTAGIIFGYLFLSSPVKEEASRRIWRV